MVVHHRFPDTAAVDCKAFHRCQAPVIQPVSPDSLQTNAFIFNKGRKLKGSRRATKWKRMLSETLWQKKYRADIGNASVNIGCKPSTKARKAAFQLAKLWKKNWNYEKVF